ncbi:MAG TPA: BTAD domain-containing putative transcriptional regulator [Steroidobacteraceae bacterium]|nr:BTAD domain-containing putative transcriptional regulator [Steroidobacteraceae bacterium]
MSVGPRLNVELLGGWRLTGPDGREVRLASRKAQALLACLALDPGASFGRDQLAQLLWDSGDAELARASLRQALSALRRALGTDAAALVCDSASVALDARLATSDVQHLRDQMRATAPDAMGQVADRYGVELLPGFDAKSASFDAWLDEHRRSLRREWTLALQRLVAHSVRVGDVTAAIDALSRLVTVDPTNETAQRDLMALYARQGHYVEALRQYRACSEALRRELDVAPDPATEALHRELLRRRRASEPGAADVPARTAASPPVTPSAPGASGDARAGVAHASAVERAATASATPTERPVATLREAVVLVARLGSQPGTHRDDPESLHAAWAQAASTVEATVSALGGVADRPDQGEIVAVFGADRTTGNELQRAVRAARRLTDRTTEPHGPSFAVGISRGLVLPAGGSSPFPLAGQAVATARRLARAAGLDATLLAADVAAQMADRDTRPAPSGADLPPSARLLTSQITDDVRDDTPALAGRRAELAMLETVLDRVRASGHGRVVIVRGEPGIGKSSLLAAVASAAAPHAAVHVTQVLDFGQRFGERPRATLAARWLGLAGGPVTPEAVGAAVERNLAAGVIEQADVAAIADLLAIEPGTVLAPYPAAATEPAARERAQAALMRRLLERVTAEQSQLVIVEDAHWADPTEIGQLADFAQAIAQRPVLLTISTRAEGDPFTEAWRARARGCPVTTLDLAPLAEDEARELAARYEGVAPDSLEHCVETAAGNPLFLVQLLRSAQAGQQALPGNVRALLLARAERLPAATQRLLHAAAILGLRFRVDALCHVAAVEDDALVALEAPGLLARDGEECQFTHALVRAAIYDSLLRSERTSLHERAAVWFELRDASLHAEHLAAAEHPGAALAHLRAAEAELHAYRFERATTHAERALALARTAHERCEAHAMLGAVYAGRGRTEQAIAAYRASTEAAADASQRARARLGLAGNLRIVDRYEEALEVVEAAEADVRGEGDLRRLAQVWTLRGNLHFPRGEIEQCRLAHERALELAQQAGSTEDVARALGGLCDAHYQRGQLLTALAYGRRCLALSEPAGLVHLRLAYLSMVASCQSYAGEFDQALDAVQQIIVEAHRVGDLRSELLACAIGSSLATYRTEYALAIDRSLRSLHLARELGAGRFEAEALIQQGAARCFDGDLAVGRRLLEEAAARAREVAVTYCGPWALAALAFHCGDAERARNLLDEGERGLALGAVSHNHFEYRLNAVELMLELGDTAGALRHAGALTEYTREEPLAWSDLVVARAQVLAAAVATGRLDADAARDVRLRAERIGFRWLLPRLDRAAATPN